MNRYKDPKIVKKIIEYVLWDKKDVLKIINWVFENVSIIKRLLTIVKSKWKPSDGNYTSYKEVIHYTIIRIIDRSDKTSLN